MPLSLPLPVMLLQRIRQRCVLLTPVATANHMLQSVHGRMKMLRALIDPRQSTQLERLTAIVSAFQGRVPDSGQSIACESPLFIAQSSTSHVSDVSRPLCDKPVLLFLRLLFMLHVVPGSERSRVANLLRMSGFRRAACSFLELL